MEAARNIYPEITDDFAYPVSEKTRTKRKQFSFRIFIFVLVFVGLAAFAHVYQQALVAQNGIEIARLKAEIKEEARISKDLETQKMLLKSPSRLGRLARIDLGMVEPTEIKYIVLPADLVTVSKAPHAPKGQKKVNTVLAKISLLAR